jgi:hypothetical protein
MPRAELSSGMHTHVANAILVGFFMIQNVAAKSAKHAFTAMISTPTST